jgi:ABC-2 type transport system permease protein
MRKFFTLWKREVATYFRSPIAYVILFFFLLLAGVIFYANLLLMNQAPTSFSAVEVYFNTPFFWFIFVPPIPLITMRLFAEEYKLGTIESLMTAPVRDMQVLLAKYFSAMFFFVVLWAPTALFFVVFQWRAHLPAASSPGVWLGAYAMLLLFGMFFVSIGCLASALTRNQIVAAIISFVSIAMLACWGFYERWFPNVSPVLRELTEYLSPIRHMAEFSQGLFDTRPVALYVSLTAMILFFTFQVFQYRRWKV